MSTAKDRYRREAARRDARTACQRCLGLGHTNHGKPPDIIFIIGPKAPKCGRCGGSGVEPGTPLRHVSDNPDGSATFEIPPEALSPPIVSAVVVPPREARDA